MIAVGASTDVAPAEAAGRPTPPPPGGRSGRRRSVGRWVVLLALVAAAVLISVLASSAPARLLDPTAAQPVGARALAQLLTDRGVQVGASSDPLAQTGGTTVVPEPGALTTGQLARLVPDAGAGTVVLIAPSGAELAAATAPVRRHGQAAISTVQAACPLPAARVAGDARLGGLLYVGPGTACYPKNGGNALMVVGVRTAVLVVLGAPDPLTNAHLGERGDAALALGLLGQHSTVRFLLPRPGATGADGSRSLVALLPFRVRLAFGELALFVLLLALARGRRLGPPVPEPLPVSVPAIETALGRGRLWRAAQARDAAADSLRAGARGRLASRLGVGGDTAGGRGAQPDRDALVQRVAASAGRPAAEVSRVLYGPDANGSPAESAPDRLTDAALTHLAADLSALDRQVRIP